jgi:hypothetical protein
LRRDLRLGFPSTHRSALSPGPHEEKPRRSGVKSRGEKSSNGYLCHSRENGWWPKSNIPIQNSTDQRARNRGYQSFAATMVAAFSVVRACRFTLGPGERLRLSPLPKPTTQVDDSSIAPPGGPTRPSDENRRAFFSRRNDLVKERRKSRGGNSVANCKASPCIPNDPGVGLPKRLACCIFFQWHISRQIRLQCRPWMGRELLGLSSAPQRPRRPCGSALSAMEAGRSNCSAGLAGHWPWPARPFWWPSGGERMGGGLFGTACPFSGGLISSVGRPRRIRAP